MSKLLVLRKGLFGAVRVREASFVFLVGVSGVPKP